jgi:signal transduction histidine kinase
VDWTWVGLLGEFVRQSPLAWPACWQRCSPGSPAFRSRRSWGQHELLVHVAAVELLGSRQLIVSAADLAPVREAQRQREETLAFVSHDLRGPASGMLMLADLKLQGRSPLPDDQLLAEMRRLAARTLALADDFVQAARAQTAPLALRETTLAALVQDGLADARSGAAAAGVSLTERIDQASPLALDRSLVERALANLVSNAIKHAPRGSVVGVHARRDHAGLVIEVTDAGAGMAADQRAALIRGEESLRVGGPGGAGLGLVFVRRVARRHGGSLSAAAGARRARRVHDSAPGRPVGSARFRESLSAPTGQPRARIPQPPDGRRTPGCLSFVHAICCRPRRHEAQLLPVAPVLTPPRRNEPGQCAGAAARAQRVADAPGQAALRAHRRDAGAAGRDRQPPGRGRAGGPQRHPVDAAAAPGPHGRRAPAADLDLSAPADPAETALSLFERRQRELLAQLRELPLVRGLSPQFGASGWDPGVLEASFLPSGFEAAALGLDAPALSAQQTLLVTWLLRGLMDSTMKPLTAGYGPQAVMRIDFAQGYALIDPQAQQALRVRRELPEVMAPGVPGADAIERDLRELVWDCGIAAGPLRLLDQPVDWWHTPLSTCADPEVQRFTRLPRHLDLAALLFRERVTPAQLQQRTGHAIAEMRPFLQACLFLGLAWWSPDT